MVSSTQAARSCCCCGTADSSCRVTALLLIPLPGRWQLRQGLWGSRVRPAWEDSVVWPTPAVHSGGGLGSAVRPPALGTGPHLQHT